MLNFGKNMEAAAGQDFEAEFCSRHSGCFNQGFGAELFFEILKLNFDQLVM